MKSLLLDFDPKEVSDFIIAQHKKGSWYSKAFSNVQFYDYDVFQRMTDPGLKAHEAFLGEDIQETDVPFDIARKLNKKECESTIGYCTHDVENTITVFQKRIDNFKVHLWLVKTFQMPMKNITKTRPQLVALALGGLNRTFNDDKVFRQLDVIQIDKYTEAVDWFNNTFDGKDSKQTFDFMISDMPTRVAGGGIHGAKKKYHGEGHYLLIDITSYYPELQVKYKIGYRNMGNPENLEYIHGENLRLKATGDKVARFPFKIADNSISGQLNQQYSSLYDPHEYYTVTLNGQMLLIDLMEKLEGACELIQSNTDGITLRLYDYEDFDLIDDIVYEWEKRTGLKMEFEEYSKVFQKDVNNYCMVTPEGKVKTKGAYVKELSDLDYDLAIVNKALIEYMVNNTPVQKTILSCDALRDFQKVVKISGKYLHGKHNNKTLNDKVFRVFASTRDHDTPIFKVKEKCIDKATGKLKKKADAFDDKLHEYVQVAEKFANTPDKCYIDNGYILDKFCPDHLDKQWYIDLAKERLAQFGVLDND